MNELEYENEHLLPEKGGVRIIRVYKLLEIIRYVQGDINSISEWVPAIVTFTST